MTESEPTVFIVDDDDEVRDSLEDLIDSVGLKAETFASAHDFLDRYDRRRLGCLVLDVRMPGMSGLELQQRLNALNAFLPIIFITGHGDIPMAVEAMQQGAVDFIQKPFRDQDLLDRINVALAQGSGKRKIMQARHEIEKRRSALTRREREVMDRVAEGKANKVIAIELGVSQRTVEVHRAHVMEKMGAKSLADLVRMADQLQE